MNHLSTERSPYLLQHRNNPVDWYPWGEEAFEKARREKKPIFLSIGYSTCHWCHVMERESFENEATAKLMNELFINIKVDREERPDVDKVYMSAVQTMVGQGGWPLSVFLTPDLKPFYGGTYFPPKDAHGRPGFPTLLQKVHEVWQNEREGVEHSGEEIIRQLQHQHPVESAAAQLDETILKRTYHQLAAGYDARHAGFGTGTKFPRPVVLNFLFRYHHRTGETEALTMSLTTLMAMASGGMADHLGGGFHRYSTDPQWRVPHFEKMLYDQAQLVHSYLDAYQLTKDASFAEIGKGTLDYVLREMTLPDGGFCSAEDADSPDLEQDGVAREGAFYTWTKAEIDQHLAPEDARIFCHHYTVEEGGNVQHDPHKEFTGKNILFNPFTEEQTAAQLSIDVRKVHDSLAASRRILFEARSSRPRPLRDDKVLTSWNGLMLGAFARSSQVLQEPRYHDAAVRSADFLRAHLYNKDKQILRRRFRTGEAAHEAHLDDYAFLADGLLHLFEATSDIQWLEWAEALAGTMITLFWDSAEGGFYDTSGKDPSILVRMKEAYDGAEPTGNSVAVHLLLRLHRITADERYATYAERTMRYFCAMLEQSPQIMPQLMAAVEYHRTAPAHLVIAAPDAATAVPLLREALSAYRPHLGIIVLTPGNRHAVIGRFPYLRDLPDRPAHAMALLCKNFVCGLPVTSPGELRKLLVGP